MDITIIYTEHAEEQSRYRELSKEQIEDTIRTAKPIKSYENRFIFQKIIKWYGKNALIRVVCLVKENVFKVITVYITTDVKRYLGD